MGGALIQTQLFVLSAWVSHSKAYRSAMPVLAGVTAATLAGQGFTGYHESLEDPLGYFTLTCERPVPEEAVEGLGEVWQTEKLVNKPYPVCGWTLAPVEGALELVKAHHLKAAEIEQIQVRVPGRRPWEEPCGRRTRPCATSARGTNGATSRCFSR